MFAVVYLSTKQEELIGTAALTRYLPKERYESLDDALKSRKCSGDLVIDDVSNRVVAIPNMASYYEWIVDNYPHIAYHN